MRVSNTECIYRKKKKATISFKMNINNENFFEITNSSQVIKLHY